MEDSWVIGQRLQDAAVARGERKVCGEQFAKSREAACARPAPTLLPRVNQLVGLFDLAITGAAVVYADAFGFDSVGRALDPLRLEALARSHGVAWDAENVGRMDLLTAFWRTEIDRDLSERAEQMKLEMENRRGNG